LGLSGAAGELRCGGEVGSGGGERPSGEDTLLLRGKIVGPRAGLLMGVCQPVVGEARPVGGADRPDRSATVCSAGLRGDEPSARCGGEPYTDAGCGEPTRGRGLGSGDGDSVVSR
jgi:hypothetical protein